MRSRTLQRTLGCVLLLAICSIMARAADEDDEDRLKLATSAAKIAVLKYADELDNKTKSPRDLEKDAIVLAKLHKIEATMKLFKPKTKGGISIGELTKAGHKDSIELLIRDYYIRPPTKAEVTMYSKELVRVGQASLVISEMTPHWGPTKTDSAGRTPQKWKALSEEMKKASVDLIAAAKAKDEKAVASAAKYLNNSCAECHKIIHDDR